LKQVTSSLIAAMLLCAACARNTGLPAVGSDQYRALCAAFYLGLAALQSGEDVNARKGLTRATEIAPGEPAGWADLGLLQFRQQDYDGAYQSVSRAQTLAPENSRMEALLGTIESRRGKSSETLQHLKRAVALDSGNLKALYALAEETERQNSTVSDADAQKLLEQILHAQPNNTAVEVDVARLAAKRNDVGTLRGAVQALEKMSASWPDAARQQLAEVEKQSNAENVRPAAVQLQFLRNVLVRVPAYRQSLNEVKTPATSAGEPFVRFLKLPSPSSQPSDSDLNLKFETKPLSAVAGPALWLGTFVPDSAAATQLLWADSRAVHTEAGAVLPLPGSGGETTLAEHAVAPADLNYDFKTDLVIATGHGIKIYQQDSPAKFSDVTAGAKLPHQIVDGNYTGVWAFDFDLDGDLDLVLGVPAGEPVVLRNNGDGTFTGVRPFRGIDGLKALVTADVDGDGDSDLAVLDGRGDLHVFANERLGDFRLRAMPAQLTTAAIALAAADVNGDGLPDFVILRRDGHVSRLSDGDHGHSWNFADLVTAGGVDEHTTLVLADLDNNGGIDIVAGKQIFLADSHGFKPVTATLPGTVRGLIERENGLLDPIALTTDQSATELVNRGTKQYRWQDVRLKAATTHGDQRINSFGIGGELQIRADLLTELQIISAPVVHFGLGDHEGAQFVRILWPNGLIQTEFSPRPNQELAAEQRLKGSCPLLYAWNGAHMQFVKDIAPMSAALGAHDGTGRFAAIDQTEEWFKIAGNALQPRDGYYDLRVTNEYWEAYFIDRYRLMAVDHPLGTQIFVDERVASPAAPLRVHVTGASHPFESALDEKGRDVTSAVATLDRKYLDTFELGSYQGIAHDHWVELALPANAPRTGPIYLIADGWLRPWDDGILVAASQGAKAEFEDLRIEVPGRDGKWHTAASNLGVPAGREKTVVFEISKLFEPGAPRKVRLRTNLEIYWDRITWATGLPESRLHTTQLQMIGAELRPRGFSQISQASARAPEVPDYEHVAATGRRWNAIEGYYTRFGNVRPLLSASDGRFVIAASGDELRLRFAALGVPQAGQVRDFILAGDGWLKEGDYSFAQSATLLPLPYRGMKRYDAPLTELEADRAYRLSPADWHDFHTRYIAAEPLSAGLWK
jgi:cytochrome c-type biogenesis protein CcmH/NrfG